MITNKINLVILTLAIFALGMVSILVEPVLDKNKFCVQVKNTLTISDFVLFYESAQMARDRISHTKVYSPLVQNEFLNKIIYPRHTSNVFYINYVPYMFAFLIPLSYMPLNIAYLVWVIFATFVGMYLFIDLLISANSLKRSEIAIVCLALFICVPSVFTLRLGQSSFLVLGFLSIFLKMIIFAKDNYLNKFFAGLALALSSIKPQYIFFYFFDLIFRRKYFNLLIFFAIVLLFVLISIVTIGLDQVLLFPKILLKSESIDKVSGLHLVGNVPSQMTNLRAIIIVFSNKIIANFLCVLAIFSFCFFQFYICQFSNLNLEVKKWYYSLIIMASVFLGPHTYIHDSILIWLAFAITVKTLNINEILKFKNEYEKLWYLLFFVYPFVSWFLLMFQNKAPIRISYLAIYNLILLIIAIKNFYVIKSKSC